MKEQLTRLIDNGKSYWNRFTPKRKKVILLSGGGILLGAILITVFLNMGRLRYRTLFSGMTQQETAQVSAAINDLDYDVDVRFDSNGNITVPAEQYDKVMLDLGGQDFPKTTLSYDIFLNNSLTATDFEKKQSLIFQLESDIQYTLTHGIDGVKNASVKLNLPQESSYAWEEKDASAASAGIIITMKSGYTLSGERVAAIKNVVAASLPGGMMPENVKVVDGATGIEVQAKAKEMEETFSVQRLEFEKQIAREMEERVRRILIPSYGTDNVAVVASVELDYDKMLTQETQKIAKDDGSGYVTHENENYTVNGGVPAGEIVGEENNTDTVPTYAANSPGDENGMTQYDKTRDYDYGEIKRQIEKGQAILKNAYVAVTVNTEAMNPERKEEIVSLVSKASGITNQDSIAVGLMDPLARQTAGHLDPGGTGKWYESIPLYAWIILTVTLAGLLFFIFFVLNRAKKKALETEQESEELINSLQAEVEERKRQLAEAAQQEINPGDGAIVQEVRTFAKNNPEITANLIRMWLKEDQ